MLPSAGKYWTKVLTGPMKLTLTDAGLQASTRAGAA